MTKELKKILLLGKEKNKNNQEGHITKQEDREMDEECDEDEEYFTKEIKKARIGYM